MAALRQHSITRWLTSSKRRAADFEIFEDDTASMHRPDTDGPQLMSDENEEEDAVSAQSEDEDEDEDYEIAGTDYEIASTDYALHQFSILVHKLMKEDKSAPCWLTTLYETPLHVYQHLVEANVQLADGLLQCLEDPKTTTPTVSMFQEASLELKRGWGVYILTLHKADHSTTETEFALYCGSGTRQAGGVATRLLNYDNNDTLPARVSQALENDYKITHKSLVAWCPMPKEYLYVDRALTLIIEATFAQYFGLHAPNQSTIGQRCLWDRQSLGYEGLCSMSALRELGALAKHLDISKEQIAEEVQRIKERIKAKNAEYFAKYYHGGKGKATKKAWEQRRLADPETSGEFIARRRERGRKYAKTERGKAKVKRYEESIAPSGPNRTSALEKKRARYAKKMAAEGKPYKPRGQYKR